MPLGGLLQDGNDALVLFSNAEFIEATPEWLGQTLGEVQAKLAQFSSPNDQKRWNQRLKDLEDQLKPNTLWRAPHASSTVGIPSVRIHPNWIVTFEEQHYALPLNQTVSELLLCGTERLPGIAEFIQLEGRLVEEKEYSSEQVKLLFNHWKHEFPPLGPAVKHSLPFSEERGYGDITTSLLSMLNPFCMKTSQDLNPAQKWLKDVSRLQAHLGVLRVWKSGVWVGIMTMIVAYYAWQLESMSTMESIVLLGLGLALSFGSNLLYWKKDPPAF